MGVEIGAAVFKEEEEEEGEEIIPKLLTILAYLIHPQHPPDSDNVTTRRWQWEKEEHRPIGFNKNSLPFYFIILPPPFHLICPIKSYSQVFSIETPALSHVFQFAI